MCHQGMACAVTGHVVQTQPEGRTYVPNHTAQGHSGSQDRALVNVSRDTIWKVSLARHDRR